ncbi:hypothetical protein NST83_20125 [Paenibacillus sp. FSL R10-2782]|uniref:hypothetical protein n=1 Tax=Paenibacillus sp. FSL R10-2782 TaxID=2954661 RepID=UPI0031590840
MGNDKRTALNLYPQKVRVASLHVGFIDTDMTAGIEAPKSNPANIAKLAIDGLESDSFEIIADDVSRTVQSGVAAIYPQLT